MDLVRGEAQYSDMELQWHDVLRKYEADSPKTAKGKLKLTFEPLAYLKDPKYYHNFAISKIEIGRASCRERV